MTSLPKTSSTLLNGESTPEGKTLEISTSKEEIGAFLGLPEVAEKKYLVDHSKPLPTSLQNDFIPEEFLLSLTSAANAGACPENLLPPKKSKTPKGGLMRKADHVWHHPVRRNKLKHLLDHPVSLTRAGRDISFLYDVRYVKGEVRENVVCPPHTEHSLQSQDGVIVPHKPKRLADTLIPEEFHIVSNTGVSGLECYDDTYTTLLTDSENRLLLFPSMKPNKRVEVAQLNDVMDTMLERAGVENEDYKGPTQMHKLLHMLKKEQTIYNTIFHELIRQVSVDCMDRGELLSKIRDRYTQMLDQIARQMIDFYKDLVTQRVMDQRILEELYNFKNVIEELTRELCLVRAHDIKLTQEAEKTHKDLAQALLDAEKNAKIVEDYHDLYTLQRGRMENDIKQLMTERDIWSSATYDLALKVIVKNKVILAKKIYLNEKGWNKYTKHFIILLSTKDTTDLALLQRLTQKWRTLITKFKQELEQTEESTKEKLQIVKNGLMTWQKVVKNNIGKDGLPSIQEDMLNSMNQECKQWIKLLSDEKDKFTGDSLVSRYDSLKIIKHLQEKWKDIGIEIFSRHKNMDGEMPLEQVYMEKIITIIVKLYKEYELRISGDYGISKSLLNIISFLDFWSFKMLNPLVFSEISPEEWEGFHKRVEEIKSHVATLSNTAGIIPEQMEMDTIEILQAQIFDMIQQWILKIGNEIDNGNIALQRHRDDLHISMIQWMVNLLILMVPGCTDQDTLPPAEEKSTETHELGIAKLELDALGLAKRLAQYSSYLTSCCKGMVTAMVLSKTAQLQNYSTKELQELESVKVYVTLNGEKIETVSDFILLGSTVNTLSSSTQEIKRRITLGKVAVKEISQVLKNNDVSLKTKRECYDWISVCGLLLSELKGRKVMLLKPEEIENLFGEEYFVNEFTEHDSEMSFKENEEESEQVKEEEDEVPSTSMGSEPLIRVIGRDKNIHTKPLFERDALSFWREVAEQGTQTQKQKYMEAMTILEHMQEKLLEVESRARKAEEKFDEANEKLHFTLLNNKNLRKELEDMSNKTEGESKRIKDKDIKEEDEDDKGDEEKEGQEAKRLTSASKSPKKDVQRKESSINTKSRVRIKSNHKMKPKQHP